MNAKIALGIATVYLAVFTVSIVAASQPVLLTVLSAGTPFLLIWTVYAVLKDRSFDYPDLPPDTEFGYLDEPR